MSDSRGIPLIVSGAPRSGTSLLYNLFDGHGEVAWLLNEGFLFEYLFDLDTDHVGLFLDAIPEDTDAFIDGLRDKQVIPPLHESYAQSRDRGSVSEVMMETPWSEIAFREALRGTKPKTVAELWRVLVRACLAGLGDPERRYACLKSPDHGRSAVAALATVSEARAVVIVRDPLYSLDSLKRSRELRGAKLLTWPLLAQNVRAFQRMEATLVESDPDRLAIVRYETLIRDAETEMRRLADWLGIAFAPALLKPTMRGRGWPGISSFQATDGIEEGPARRPIAALTSDEQAYIRRHLASLRERFDYP